jgi:hypothetical protein
MNAPLTRAADESPLDEGIAALRQLYQEWRTMRRYGKVGLEVILEAGVADRAELIAKFSIKRKSTK